MQIGTHLDEGGVRRELRGEGTHGIGGVVEKGRGEADESSERLRAVSKLESAAGWLRRMAIVGAIAEAAVQRWCRWRWLGRL